MRSMKRSIASLLALVAVSRAAMTFVHPGAMESREELLFVKAKIAAGAQPWTGQYQSMRQYVVPGSGQTPGDEGDQRTQAQRAYANALAYWYTGNTQNADQAIAIIKQWASFRPYDVPVVDANGYTSCTQSMLDASWMGDLLGPAAELLRGYMSTTDMAAVRNVFQTVFIPSLSVRDPSNSNRDFAGIKALFSIAVFMEDTVLFNKAVQRFKERMPAAIYLRTDGPNPPDIKGASWANYTPNFASPNADGLTQETCRDMNHHAHFIIAGMTNAAEIAWHQGVDLYGQYQARITAALELMSKELVSGDMQGVCKSGNTSITTDLNTFDVAYNHYHNRMGLALPNTLALLPQSRAQSSWWVTFFETLTHADLPAPTPLSSSSGNGTSSSSRTASSSSQAVPNLIHSVTIPALGPVTIQIYSMTGTLLRETRAAGDLSLRVLGAGLPKDLYIVRRSVLGHALSSTVMKFNKEP